MNRPTLLSALALGVFVVGACSKSDDTGTDPTDPGCVVLDFTSVDGEFSALSASLSQSDLLGYYYEPALVDLRSQSTTARQSRDDLAAVACPSESDQTALSGLELSVQTLGTQVDAYVASPPPGFISRPTEYMIAPDRNAYSYTGYPTLLGGDYLITMERGPSWLSVAPDGLTLTGNPSASDDGIHVIEIAARSSLGEAHQIFELVVASRQEIGTWPVDQASELVVVLADTGTNLDGTTLTFPSGSFAQGALGTETVTVSLLSREPVLLPSETSLARSLSLTTGSGDSTLVEPMTIQYPFSTPVAPGITDDAVQILSLGTGAAYGADGCGAGVLVAVEGNGTTGRPRQIEPLLKPTHVSDGVSVDTSVPGFKVVHATDTDPAYLATVLDALGTSDGYFAGNGFTTVPEAQEITVRLVDSMRPGALPAPVSEGCRAKGALGCVPAGTYRLMYINRGISSDVCVRNTVAHELFHIVQTFTLYSKSSVDLFAHVNSHWALEATASYMENEVYDADSLPQAVRAQNPPSITGVPLDSMAGGHEYDMFLFFEFLKASRAFSMQSFWNNVPASTSGSGGREGAIRAATGMTQYLSDHLDGLDEAYVEFLNAYNVVQTDAVVAELASESMPLPLPLVRQLLTVDTDLVLGMNEPLGHLTGRSYMVDVEAADGYTVEVELTGGVDMDVAVYLEGETEILGTFMSASTTQNLGDQGGQALAVHVANTEIGTDTTPVAYMDETYTLTLRLVPEPTPPAFAYISENGFPEYLWTISCDFTPAPSYSCENCMYGRTGPLYGSAGEIVARVVADRQAGHLVCNEGGDTLSISCDVGAMFANGFFCSGVPDYAFGWTVPCTSTYSGGGTAASDLGLCGRTSS